MGTLEMHDGQVLENSEALEIDRELYIYISGLTLTIVFQMLTDEEKTETITYRHGPGETVFTGYTKLIAVRDEGNDLVTAVMRKAE